MNDLFETDAEYDSHEQRWYDWWAVHAPPGWEAPWLNNFLADGAKLRDANPVFSAWSPQERRGVRLIQDRQQESVNYYFDTFGELPEEQVRNLVVHCGLDPEAQRIAEFIMGGWARHGTVPKLLSRYGSE